MKQRFLLFSLRGLLLLATMPLLLAGCSSAPPPQYTVAIVNPSSGLDMVVEGFKEGLAQKGYTEGRNISFHLCREMAGTAWERLLSALREGDVDLVYTLTTPATQKIKAALAGSTIPQIFAPVFSPEESGIVDSLHNPPANITGIKMRGCTPKALEWFHRTLPEVKHIFVPFHSTDEAAQQTLQDLREAAATLDIELVTGEVTSRAELETILTEIPEESEAIWLTCSHLLFSHVGLIVAAANRRGLPVASSAHQQQNGVLLTYGENNAMLGRQASRMAAKILQGSAPADLPVETAEFFLGLDLRAAGQLGIEIPSEILQQADIIER